MLLVLDMNLSPDLCAPLSAAGHEAVHWSTLGAPTASDESIMAYARDHGLVVVTHDLDFGAILAATHAHGPSVVQATVGISAKRLSRLMVLGRAWRWLKRCRRR